MNTDTEEKITLGSGFEGRIVAEYLTRRKRLRNVVPDCTAKAINDIWLDMARKHQRPVRELKDILNRYQTEQDPSRSLTPPERHRACGCNDPELGF